MKSSSSTQAGSAVPLILLWIGAILVLSVLLMIGFELILIEVNPIARPSVEYSPQTSSLPILQLGSGGYPITPTPFQPLPTSTPTPIPSPTSQPTLSPSPIPTVKIPASARIEAIRGFPQTLNLSCESRSAVDWAGFFGVSINELEFLSQLPQSDDPNKGFVGNPNGPGGLIPPNPYGVHAAPVAALLRAYGLPAEDIAGLTIDQIKTEIAAGRPVIVWVIFGTMPGSALQYTTQAGEVVSVAPNEHTAIIIGYDPQGVALLDGAAIYWRSWDTFLQSFMVLGNMAIIYRSQ